MKAIPSSLSRIASGCLAPQVRELLDRAPYAALRSLRCEEHEGVLILRGHVSSYFLKQIAQELATRVDGIEWIDNRIEVLNP
jgi:hypothetical protein